MNSIMQETKECYITHSPYHLARHHVFAGPRRQLSEQWGCWVWLRADWHNLADYGVHGKNGHALDMRLKRECQRRFEELYGRDKFMEIFKKNYLEDEQWA